MATNLQVYNVAKSSVLAPRVLGQLLKYAADIRAEDPATSNHANRILWANAVMKEDANGEMVKRMLVYCAQNATIAEAGDSATDNDIAYVVVTVLDQEADGVYGG